MKQFRLYQLAIMLVALCLHVSCQERDTDSEVATKKVLDPAVNSFAFSISGEAKSSQNGFIQLDPKATGILHENKLDLNHEHKAVYVSGWVCGGVVVEDFNNDERPDLFFPQNAGKNKLYIQTEETLKFTEVGAHAGVSGEEGFSAGAAAGDVDGDGDIDLYVCNYNGANQLYLNQGTDEQGLPIFKELALPAGVNVSDASLNASFCDYDRDGDLDLFILSNRHYHPTGFPEGPLYEMVNGKPQVLPHLSKYYTALLTEGTEGEESKVLLTTVGRACYLFENQGNSMNGIPKFKDVSAISGVGTFRNYGLSSIWHDFNADGYPDLYIANDFEYDDRLLINQRNGTFVNASKTMLPATPYFSMGSTIADFDGDSREDLFVVDMAATSHYKAKIAMGALTPLQTYVLDNAEPRQAMRNMLLLDSGTGKMREAAYLAGIAKSDWSWTPLAADFDNDGDQDIYITNGMVRDFANADVANERSNIIESSEWSQYENTPERPETNLFYQNEGDLKFKEVAQKQGVDHKGMSYAAAWADLDGDGRVEMIVSNLNEPPHIYHNKLSQENNRVIVSLDQLGSSNKRAIGSKVTIVAGGKEQVRTLQPAVGFLSSNQPVLHFGLGKATSIESITIQWPDGTRQVHNHLAVNHHHKITRIEKTREYTKPAPKPTLFVRNTLLDGSNHMDPQFDDFKLQPLLPNKLSHQGPGHAWADFNGDGTKDFFLASGAGDADRIYWLKNNRFVRGDFPAFEADAAGESIAALVLDIDSDGDDDLYVSRGSYEFLANDPRQQDRIYLNDGSGNFTVAPSDVIPNNQYVSGHVAAMDIDRDGDLDLLVTSRVTPGAYPLAPTSRLLRNDSKDGTIKLTDITSTHAPALTEAGMVTAAVFSDATGDNVPDILLATEYNTVMLLENKSGRFVRKTDCATLSSLYGWWHSICPSDVDQDGDMDYIVGNLGTNTKYQPTGNAPYFIFYGDMDGSGKNRIVEAKTPKKKGQIEKAKPLPVRGRS